MRSKKIQFSLVLAAVFLCQLENNCFPQEAIPHGSFKGNRLDDRVSCALLNTNLMFRDCRACDFIVGINAGSELNISLAEAVREKTNLFSVSVSSKPKREVLDEIIKQNPGYAWSEVNGVINIQPYETSNSLSSVSVFDKTIPDFEVHGIPTEWALERLVEIGAQNGIPLTTLNRVMALRHGIKWPAVDEVVKKGFKYTSPEELITVVIKHKVTIRDCLNAIVLANPPSRWISTREGDKTLLRIGSHQSYKGGLRDPENDKYPAYRLEPPKKEK